VSGGRKDLEVKAKSKGGFWKISGYLREEDVKWQLILLESTDDLLDEDADDPEIIEFLDNEIALRAFLVEFLAKYRSSSAVYSRRYPA
jgi:hypothetical protein